MPIFLLKRKPFCHYSERYIGRNGREKKELWLIRKFCTDRTVGGFEKDNLSHFRSEGSGRKMGRYGRTTLFCRTLIRELMALRAEP